MSSKVVLFIVEGFSDQNSFENILNHLSLDKIKFKIVKGDITANSSVNTIRKNIAGCVNNFLKLNKFYSTDIKK